MPRFSERIGARAMPRQIQVESMDAALRNSLWNAILEHFTAPFLSHWGEICRRLAKHLYKQAIDTVPYGLDDDSFQWVRARFFNAAWHEAYDIVEFLAQNLVAIKSVVTRQHGLSSEPDEFRAYINKILERELAGYRFIRGQLAPIIDPAEIATIESAASHVKDDAVLAASAHIRSALGLLGQKPVPDFRNSIKESISAVESVVRSLTGASSVGKAIDVLSKKAEIHPAFQSAVRQLYGFTSDANGIRHALLEEKANVGFAEAKFMLVACSGFVNFLLDKGREVGVEP